MITGDAPKGSRPSGDICREPHIDHCSYCCRDICGGSERGVGRRVSSRRHPRRQARHQSRLNMLRTLHAWPALEGRTTPSRTHFPAPSAGRQTAKISEIGDGIAAAKARRSIKLREVEVALRRAGLIALDEQARALGLSRTTTWKILRGNRRSSEPSAATINRILCAPRLPLPVRIKILEYVQERVSGMYGHDKSQLRRFSIRIGWDRAGQP